MDFKVVASGARDPAELALLEKVGARLVVAPLKNDTDVAANASDADAVLVAANDNITRKGIGNLGRCRLLSRSGVGHENIDVRAATEQGILVAIVPDASIDEVSDHAIGMLLSFSRKLIPLSLGVRAGLWKAGATELAKIRGPVFRLNTQTLGLVGIGRIGAAVAKKAQAFGLKVVAYDPYVSKAPPGIVLKDLDRVLAESDFISIHCPLTEENRGLFSLERFKKMKRTAYLINTARGGLVDENALCVALKEGYIAGAGIDVMDPEPPAPDNPLLKLDNAIITAHSAFYSEASMKEIRQRSLDAVLQVLQGQWPGSLANPQAREKYLQKWGGQA